jgi:hypothetical protein
MERATMAKTYIRGAILLLVLSVSSPAGSPPAGDPQILALVESEYTSVEDFLLRISDLEAVLASKGDSRAIFAGMYRVLTENGVRSIEDGTYTDPDWVERLVVAFGNLYREAFYHFETGDYEQVPEVWLVVFEANRANEITAFQHGLLGVHAHINRDLPHALAQATPPEKRSARFIDFQRTNRMVVQSTEDVEAVVANTYGPALDGLDTRFRKLDELLLGQLVSEWRQRAWWNARFFDGNRPEWVERLGAAYLDRITARQARAMAAPNPDGTSTKREIVWRE